MVAEDVNAGRLGLPWRTAVSSGEGYYLVWPRGHRAASRINRLSEYLQAEVARMGLPEVSKA